MVIFRCLCDGWCCRRYWIPITHLDLLRLRIYGGIRIDESIVELKEKDVYDIGDLYPPIKINKNEYYISLASKDDGSCIFLLSNGRCSVHEFKPLVCRFYPFVYWIKDDGDIGVDINEKAVGECPGLVLDDRSIPDDIAEGIKSIARIRREELKLWSDTITEWNLFYGDNEDANLRTFLTFILKKAEDHRNYLLHKGLWIR